MAAACESGKMKPERMITGSIKLEIIIQFVCELEELRSIFPMKVL
jgi:hypothetical protein